MQDARVVELVDSLASGASALYGRAGSTPASRTNVLRTNLKDAKIALQYGGLFLCPVAVAPIQ